MNVSELIETLVRIREEQGDLEVSNGSGETVTVHPCIFTEDDRAREGALTDFLCIS